jgi:hypothetical protein
LVLANVAFSFTVLPYDFLYRTLRFRFDNEGVAVSHGLFWRRETYLTYARMRGHQSAGPATAPPPGDGVHGVLATGTETLAVEALVGIRDELRAVRLLLETQAPGARAV